jgi:hypothetical protein
MLMEGDFVNSPCSTLDFPLPESSILPPCEKNGASGTLIELATAFFRKFADCGQSRRTGLPNGVGTAMASYNRIGVSLMRFDDYTPDTICVAMGLKGLKDDVSLNSADESLRVLLTPSFSPEICATLVLRKEHVALDCRAFATMLWHAPTAADRPPLLIEAASIQRAEFTNLAARLCSVRQGVEREAKKRVVDGMEAHIVLYSPAGVVGVSANVGGSDVLLKYVADFISAIYETLPRGRCRNAVAQAARYVDLVLPLDELETPKSITQILMLGEPELKKELIDRLADREATDEEKS